MQRASRRAELAGLFVEFPCKGPEGWLIRRGDTRREVGRRRAKSSPWELAQLIVVAPFGPPFCTGDGYDLEA